MTAACKAPSAASKCDTDPSEAYLWLLAAAFLHARGDHSAAVRDEDLALADRAGIEELRCGQCPHAAGCMAAKLLDTLGAKPLE